MVRSSRAALRRMRQCRSQLGKGGIGFKGCCCFWKAVVEHMSWVGEQQEWYGFFWRVLGRVCYKTGNEEFSHCKRNLGVLCQSSGSLLYLVPLDTLITILSFFQWWFASEGKMSPEVALNRISPVLSPFISSVIRNGKVGLDATNCLRITDLKSGCTSLTPGPNCDRFKLHIPYAGETLKCK